MRWLITTLTLAACAPAPDPGSQYLADPAFRRASLASALVNPDNGYSRLRLQHYATGADGDWERLPEWNPAVSAGGPLALDADLRALGEAAFFRFPAQGLPATVDRASISPLSGLWHDPASTDLPGGLVEVAYSDGSSGLGLTCSTCHARVVDGILVAGLANQDFDYRELVQADAPSWGPGRIDVAPPPGEEPVAIPDLRPVGWLTHLHRDGTVLAGLVPLAIRIETLLITSAGGAVRPPREIALALATYLQSLAPPASTADSHGRQIFDRRCGYCHAGPGLSGPPVLLGTIGTDPRVGLSADRGTGGYRVPSLLGLGTRGRLLHDNSIADIETLLDPTRSNGGHRFGLALDPSERQQLIAFLQTL